MDITYGTGEKTRFGELKLGIVLVPVLVTILGTT